MKSLHVCMSWRRVAIAAIGIIAIPAALVRAADRAAPFSAKDFERHVRFLADDRLAGRGIGTPGIEEAAAYIAQQFEEAGVRPGGDNGTFFQSFAVSVSSRIADDTRLAFGGSAFPERWRLKLRDDFIPFPFSARGGFDGPVAFVGYGIAEDEEHAYDDYAGVDMRGRVALMLRYEPGWWSTTAVDEQENAPAAQVHSRHAYFTTKVEHAVRHGAKAVLIVNPAGGNGKAADPLYDFASGRAPRVDLPILHVTRAAANRLLKAGGLPSIETLQRKIEKSRKPASAMLRDVRVNGYADIAKVQTPVRNVVGLIPGRGAHADETIVVGAHYDHLGLTTNWKTPNDPKKYIHNGADDNASGTTGLILLARALTQGQPPARSVLLIAFTGEESGLLGSKHWVAHPTIPCKQVACMLNMDMIGRLKRNVLLVGGMGTGKSFKESVEALAKPFGFEIRSGGGGQGPSDHASFYSEKIPVLFFFTGLHRQYHQPDDDADLINFDGGARVTQFVYDCLLAVANRPERPKFERDTTRFRRMMQDEDEAVAQVGARKQGNPTDHSSVGGEGETPSMPRVRMGIAPGNYGEEEEERGFPVDYVSAGGPAEKAGIRDKDRILSIDGRKIGDVYAYMNQLSKHKPGDVIEVVVLRDRKELTFKVKLEPATRGPARE